MAKCPECFEANISDLHTVSHDDKNNQYMTDSCIAVYDFDGIKDWYWSNVIKRREKGPSNDALYIDGDRMVFIEFKNGNFEVYGKNGLVTKIYDSLLILFDEETPTKEVCKDFRASINWARSHIEYILVYNKDKIPPEHNSRKKINMELGRLARFGLSRYEGFLFSKVRTYTVDEFEAFFVNNVQ